MHTAIYEINTKDLLYSTGNYTQYLVIPIMEKNIKYICVCVYVYKSNHFAIHLKLAQLCKSAILQFKKLSLLPSLWGEGVFRAQALPSPSLNQWIKFLLAILIKTLLLKTIRFTISHSSVGQEYSSGLAGWFWLRFFHRFHMSSGATVICGFTGLQELLPGSQGHSETQIASQCWTLEFLTKQTCK